MIKQIVLLFRCIWQVQPIASRSYCGYEFDASITAHKRVNFSWAIAPKVFDHSSIPNRCSTKRTISSAWCWMRYAIDTLELNPHISGTWGQLLSPETRIMWLPEKIEWVGIHEKSSSRKWRIYTYVASFNEADADWKTEWIGDHNDSSNRK